jgi:hypothetical protein
VLFTQTTLLTTIASRCPHLFFAGGLSSTCALVVPQVCTSLALGPPFLNQPNKPFIFALTLPALGFAGSGGSSGPRPRGAAVGCGSIAGPSAQGFSSILRTPCISGDVIYIEIESVCLVGTCRQIRFCCRRWTEKPLAEHKHLLHTLPPKHLMREGSGDTFPSVFHDYQDDLSPMQLIGRGSMNCSLESTRSTWVRPRSNRATLSLPLLSTLYHSINTSNPTSKSTCPHSSRPLLRVRDNHPRVYARPPVRLSTARSRILRLFLCD